MHSPMSKPKITFVTGNANKLAEVQQILGDTVELTSADNVLPEIQGSIVEICTDKCNRAATLLGGAVLVEDTCLGFDAMGGMPGPYIKHFLKALTVSNLYKMLEGFENKSAEAICTFAYSQGPGQEPILFTGRTPGTIVPAKGLQNFGWDACFEYEGKTYAQMTKEEKNAISHRGKALKELQEWISDNT